MTNVERGEYTYDDLELNMRAKGIVNLQNGGLEVQFDKKTYNKTTNEKQFKQAVLAK